MQGKHCILFSAFLLSLPLQAKVVVFWQPEFPTVASQPIPRAALDKALDGLTPVYADEAALVAPEALADTDLLVLPYGSAVPVDSWKAIQRYLDGGGNLLILGGQPLRVPVSLVNGQYVAATPQDTYSRTLGFRHTYEVPVTRDAEFHWRTGYAWLPPLQIHALHFFTVEGRLNGLGYMADREGQLVAAPVIVADHAGRGPDNHMLGSRFVALDFDPDPGYWESTDGIALVHQAATYAAQGATGLGIETLFSVIRTTESPTLTVHLRFPRQQKLGSTVSGEVQIQLSSEKEVVAKATVPLNG